MAAPIHTRVRVGLTRTRPRDTTVWFPTVIIYAAPQPGVPTPFPGYVAVYLTRRRPARGRQTRYFLRGPQITGTPPAPVVTRTRVTLFQPRPRRYTRSRIGPPRVVTVPTPVLSRTVRTRINLVRLRRRRVYSRLRPPTLVGAPLPPPPPAPPVTRVQTTLGCGEYAVYVMKRGGGVYLGEVPWTSLQWTRTVDDTSTAQVTAQVGLCSEIMALARPWRHELVVFRSGEQVWCGPIYQVVGDPNNPSISARDLSSWWDRRLVHNSHDYTGTPTDLATIFQAIHDDAMNVDNSMGFVLEATPTGVMGEQQVFSDQRQAAGAFLRDLAQAGVDWTVVGRTVHVGGRVVPGDSLINVLGDDHFMVPPVVTYDGSNQANREIVQGSGGNDDGAAIEGIAEDADAAAADGLLEIVESVSTITDETSAAASAVSKLQLNTAPVVVSDAALTADAPLLIGNLIPGLVVTLVLTDTSVQVSGQLRLSAVSVAADPQNGEVVTISLQPIGSQ